MTIRPTRNGYSWFILFVILTACNTQGATLPTQASASATVSPSPIPTASLTYFVTPSPLPTEPIALLITPDAIQMDRWNEYEDALALAFFRSLRPEQVVCEWVILGRAERQVYVSAYCAGVYSAGPSQADIPAVIHLQTDGTVQSAEIPGAGTSYGADIRQMFPLDLQEKIFSHTVYSRELWERMRDRIRWRRGHPDEPPLIVYSALGIQPTPAVIPWITPEVVQVEKWQEYQTALAGVLAYLDQERSVCEWEFLGRTGNEVYVWAICGVIGGKRVGLEGLVKLGVVDGTIVNVLRSDDPQVYSSEVRERYFSGQIHFQELVDHLRWRQIHSEEPPLVVVGIPLAP